MITPDVIRTRIDDAKKEVEDLLPGDEVGIKHALERIVEALDTIGEAVRDLEAAQPKKR
jgi:hypothetical protein